MMTYAIVLVSLLTSGLNGKMIRTISYLAKYEIKLIQLLTLLHGIVNNN